mmetsp:Transcript_56664/g.83156  ORF Transcript_56664/g.83156 Transcript_56664/m.83156 type:complete len:217 (+) Transcript_56664:1050-1700(+)
MTRRRAARFRSQSSTTTTMTTEWMLRPFKRPARLSRTKRSRKSPPVEAGSRKSTRRKVKTESRPNSRAAPKVESSNCKRPGSRRGWAMIALRQTIWRALCASIRVLSICCRTMTLRSGTSSFATGRLCFYSRRNWRRPKLIALRLSRRMRRGARHGTAVASPSARAGASMKHLQILSRRSNWSPTQSRQSTRSELWGTCSSQNARRLLPRRSCACR